MKLLPEEKEIKLESFLLVNLILLYSTNRADSFLPHCRIVFAIISGAIP
jgi:hypothetical protein